MLIRILAALTTLFFVSPIFAQTDTSKGDILVLKPEMSQKKFVGGVNLGVAVPKTRNSLGEEENQTFGKIEIEGRYAPWSWIGFELSLAKWIGDNEFTSQTGSLAYNISGGLTFALTGSLIDHTRIDSKVVRKKTERDGDMYFETKIVKRITRNDYNGFRLNVHASQFDFSKDSYSMNGWGAKLFYEHRAFSNIYLRYGIQGEFIKDSNIKADLWQGFVGLGF